MHTAQQSQALAGEHAQTVPGEELQGEQQGGHGAVGDAAEDAHRAQPRSKGGVQPQQGGGGAAEGGPGKERRGRIPATP